jgi:hypothetical protein
MGTPKKANWVSLLDKCPGEARQAMECCLIAEEFLGHAVDAAGIDWCFDRLKQVKKAKGNISTIRTLIFDQLFGVSDGHS